MKKKLGKKTTISFLLPPLFFAFMVQSRFVEIQNETDFNKYVTNNKQPTLVQFSADWCGVCQTVKKPFETVAKDPEFKGVTFARVNIDNNINLSKKNDIMGVPTFLYINNGKNIKNEVGVKNIDTFKESLRNTVRDTFQLAQADTAKTMDETTMNEPMDNMMEQKADMDEPMDNMTEQDSDKMSAMDEMEKMPDDETMEADEEIIQPESPAPEDMMEMQETTEYVQEAPEEKTGFFEGIKNIIMGIINAIMGLLKGIVDTIKGLFAR